MQADIWDSAAPPSELTAFAPFKALIADRAARFRRPVLLLEGPRPARRTSAASREGSAAATSISRCVASGSSPTSRT